MNKRSKNFFVLFFGFVIAIIFLSLNLRSNTSKLVSAISDELISIPEGMVYVSKTDLAPQSINKIAFNMIKRYPNDENSIFSPASLALSLGLLNNGVSDDYQNEIRDYLLQDSALLEGDSASSDGINDSFNKYVTYLVNVDTINTMKYGNSIWFNSSSKAPNPEFTDISHNYYYSELFVSDFDSRPKESMKKVNAWVSLKTNGVIPTIMNKIPENLYCSMINTIYFKGEWKSPFKKRYTRNKPFHLNDNDEIKVPTMHATDDLVYYKGDNFSAVQKKFKGGHWNLNILLPSDDSSVDEVITEMDSKLWNRILDNYSYASVDLSLPKFKFDYTAILNDNLKSEGVTSVFDSSLSPLNNISSNIYVSSVRQRCFIEVNETGAEAAAATIIEKTNKSAPPKNDIKFTVDRPFIFIISDTRTQSVLFIGKVYDPRK